MIVLELSIQNKVGDDKNEVGAIAPVYSDQCFLM
jgi:hypothetical protein